MDTIGSYGDYPEQYVEQILHKAATAVQQAARNLSSISQPQSGTLEMPLDGRRVVVMIRDDHDPGPVAPAGSVVQAIAKDQKTVGNTSRRACHPARVPAVETPLPAGKAGPGGQLRRHRMTIMRCSANQHRKTFDQRGCNAFRIVERGEVHIDAHRLPSFRHLAVSFNIGKKVE